MNILMEEKDKSGKYQADNTHDLCESSPSFELSMILVENNTGV